MNSRVLVTGAGGFIGHHLVNYLKARGCWVRGVDLKEPEYAATSADDFRLLDLRRWESCLEATHEVDEVYALAADMGGMGFISANHALILHNNALINIHTLEAAHQNNVKRLLYTSSACVYPEFKQTEANVTPLKEDDAYPAQPQDAYGWEKLITERLCFHYAQDYGMETRIVRFHNIFGPLGTWDGGREKAPAAMCRKVAAAKLSGNHEIEIWGDGEQTRLLLLHRRLSGRLASADALGFSGAAEPWSGSNGDHQSACRYRCEDRGNSDREETYRRADGRSRQEFGQYPAAKSIGLGTRDFAGGWSGPDLFLDRSSDAIQARRGSPGCRVGVTGYFRDARRS